MSIKIKIAICASGSGTNAESLMKYFYQHKYIEVALLLCNNPHAYVLQRAKHNSIPSILVDKSTFFEGKDIIRLFKSNNISLIVLAGFLWILPSNLVCAFPRKIINIHPSLLPKFGGKGMYGMNVHEAVIKAKESESGITIHYVDKNVDTGKVILQKKYQLTPGETPETLASNILKLEHKYYPLVIEKLLAQAYSLPLNHG